MYIYISVKIFHQKDSVYLGKGFFERKVPEDNKEQKCIYTALSISLLMDLMICFHVLAIANNAAMSLGSCIFSSYSFAKYRMEVLVTFVVTLQRKI